MSTIYALSTPEGRSAIAVFRLSGPKSYEILLKLTESQELLPRQAYLKKIVFDGELIDRTLIFYFKAPHSFTGEECAEFHLHGSPALLRIFPQILTKLGCRLAEPGEFTKRAFYNDCLDLTQIEGLSYLIQAETEAQHRVAVKQADGYARKIFEDWREILLTQLAYIEADIDFVEGELPHSFVELVKQKLAELLEKIIHFKKLHENVKSLRDGLRVALIGAPNVGKSTLYNLILQRDAALVSEIAGTTRDILEAKVNFDGYPILLADMAGIRDSAESIEAEGIKRAKQWQESADIKIYLLSQDQELPSNIDDIVDHSDLVILNKADLGSNHQIPTSPKILNLSLHDPLSLSLVMDKLSTLIKAKQPEANAVYYLDAYNEAVIHTLIENLTALLEIDQIEFIAAELRSALHSLGKITGHVDVEDVLGKIFSSFCIGK